MTTNTNNDDHRGLMVQQNEIRGPPELGGGEGGLVAEENQGLKKGPWTAVEDQILTDYVRKHGEGNWNSLQRNSGLNRCGKSCRLRWANHLRPHLKKGAFSPQEERLILELHAKYGNKWARMASQLPGRTDNEIKNYWNTRVKKRQRQGRPLYPHDIQKSHSISNFQSTANPSTIQNPAFQLGTTPTFRFQGNHCKPPPLPPTQSSLPMSPLSSPHQSNSSTNTPSSFIFNGSPPTLGVAPPLGYRSYRDCAGFSPPISPNPQRNSSILRTSSMPDIAAAMSGIQTSSSSSMPDISASFHQLPPGTNTIFHDIIPSFHQLTADTNNYSLNNNNVNIGLASFDQFPATTFNPPFPPFPHSRFEYPDTILSSTGSLYSDQVTLGPKAAAVATADIQQINPTRNGLLDDLLLEADRAFAYDNSMQLGSSFEEKHATLDPYGGHWRLPPPTSMDSSSLEAKQQADDNNLGLNSMPEDLSELFSFSPSTAEPASVAHRYSDSGDFSNAHCSGLTVANSLDDMQLSFIVNSNVQ